MNVLDRLDQLEREGTSMRVTVLPSEDGSSLMILDHCAVSRAHLRALLDVARAANRATGHLFSSPLEGSLDRYEEITAALAPLLEDTSD